MFGLVFQHRTYLAGHELSLADVAVYVGLSGSRYAPPKVRIAVVRPNKRRRTALSRFPSLSTHR